WTRCAPPIRRPTRTSRSARCPKPSATRCSCARSGPTCWTTRSSSARRADPPLSASARARPRKALSISCATTASALTCATRTNSSACSIVSIARRSLSGTVWVWPPCSASSTDMAAGSGPRRSRAKARRFISLCPPRNLENYPNGNRHRAYNARRFRGKIAGRVSARGEQDVLERVARMMASARRDFCLRNSTAKEFHAHLRGGKSAVEDSARPGNHVLGISAESLLALLAHHQHPDQEADPECRSNRFVRMSANRFVTGFGPFNRLFFQPTTSGLCRLESFSKALAHIASL